MEEDFHGVYGIVSYTIEEDVHDFWKLQSLSSGTMWKKRDLENQN